MRYVDLLAAAFLVLSGLYLLYYFVVVDVRGDTSSITDSVQRWQNRVSTTAVDQLGAGRRRSGSPSSRRRRLRRPAAADDRRLPHGPAECSATDGDRPAPTGGHGDGRARRRRGGVEVFMLRRVVGAAFAAGMLRVPRGPGRRRRRRSGHRALRRRPRRRRGVGRRSASSAAGWRYWVAAIRECFEESGTAARPPRRRRSAARPEADRAAVHRGELSMIELCRRHDLVLDAGALRYVGPLGDAGRRDAAPLRHPLLPRRRPRRPGRGTRRRRDGRQSLGRSRRRARRRRTRRARR